MTFAFLFNCFNGLAKIKMCAAMKIGCLEALPLEKVLGPHPLLYLQKLNNVTSSQLKYKILFNFENLFKVCLKRSHVELLLAGKRVSSVPLNTTKYGSLLKYSAAF